MNNLIRISEVSTMLGIARSTVYKMVQQGELEHVKVGKSIRFDPDSIAAYVKAQTQRTILVTTSKHTNLLKQNVKGAIWDI